MQINGQATTNATNASLIVSGTSSVAVATGTLDTINLYVPLVGLIISAISLILAIVFFSLNHKREMKKIELKEKYLELELKQISRGEQ